MSLQERIEAARIAQSGELPKGATSSQLKAHLNSIWAKREAERKASLSLPQRFLERFGPLFSGIATLLLIAGLYALLAAILMLIWDLIAASMGWRELPFVAAFGIVLLLLFIKGLLKPTN